MVCVMLLEILQLLSLLLEYYAFAKNALFHVSMRKGAWCNSYMYYMYVLALLLRGKQHVCYSVIIVFLFLDTYSLSKYHVEHACHHVDCFVVLILL